MQSALLKPRDAAAYIGVSLRTFEDLCRRGEIRAFFIGDGRLRRAHREDLDAFIAERRASAVSA